MPLRQRLFGASETVQDFELGAEQRYWEGVELMVAGRPFGGVYVIGYAAEMLLKRACFIVDGARPSDMVGPRLGPIRSWARRQLPDISPEQFHSLLFWAHVLRFKRRLAGRQFDQQFDARLVQRMRRLYGNWLVSMRYYPGYMTPLEVRSVYDDVTWLRDHRLLLER